MGQTLRFAFLGRSYDFAVPSGNEARPLLSVAPDGGRAVELGARDCGLAKKDLARLVEERLSRRSMGDERAAMMDTLLSRIAAEGRSTRPGAEALRAALVVELLVLALRALDAAEDSGPWSIERAVRHVRTRYPDAFTLDFFVTRCATNESDFCRKFKAATGYPLFEYLNRVRVEKACRLLKTTELSVTEIALAVGYNNVSYFNRYFLRLVGLPPRAYRNSSR